MTSAMPSTAKVNLAPHCGIHVYDSRNWNRSPVGLNCSHSPTVSARISSDQPKAARLASSGLSLGRNAIPAAPTSGADREHGQIRKGAHPNVTASMAATTSTAPPRMDRA